MQNPHNGRQPGGRFISQQGFPGYPQYAPGYGAIPYPQQKEKKQKREDKDTQAHPGNVKKRVSFVEREKSRERSRDRSPESDRETGPEHVFIRLRKTEMNRVNYEIVYSNLACKQIMRNQDVVTIVLDKAPVNVRASQAGVGVQVEDLQIKLTLKPQSTDESVAVIVTY